MRGTDGILGNEWIHVPPSVLRSRRTEAVTTGAYLSTIDRWAAHGVLTTRLSRT